jgi:sulfite reductase alpha subunit-like flavoprotein
VQDRLRTDRDRLMPMLAESNRALIYICGIAGMELGIFQQLARILPQGALEQYLQVDAQTMSDIPNWNRKMIHRQIKATKRVFLEVYD